MIQNKYEIKDNYVVIYVNERAVQRGKLQCPFEALISVEDFNKIMNTDILLFARCNTNGEYPYLAFSEKYLNKNAPKTKYKRYKTVLWHRWVLNVKKSEIVDHINRNPLDNRRENLRVVTHAENMKNRRSWGKVKQKGVCYIKKENKYSSSVYIGKYDSQEEAQEILLKARKLLYENGLLFSLD